MRALYTSASGLVAQQTKFDVISNNIANLNTVGYKTKHAQFAELLRSQFVQPEVFQLNGRRSDLGLRVGNGVYGAYLAPVFAQGNLQETGNMLDLAVEGEGFFTVRVPAAEPNGQPVVAFTRAGKFQMDAAGMIVNDDGYPLLDNQGRPIVIPEPLRGRPLTVAPNGDITVQGDDGPVYIATVNLVLVRNPEANLEAVGNNLYQNKNPNYQPLQDSLNNLQAPEDRQRIGSIRQGVLELSNVDLPEEMTKLIEVQRAYQLNARSVQTVDAMMGIANNLRA